MHPACIVCVETGVQHQFAHVAKMGLQEMSRSCQQLACGQNVVCMSGVLPPVLSAAEPLYVYAQITHHHIIAIAMDIRCVL